MPALYLTPETVQPTNEHQQDPKIYLAFLGIRTESG